MVRIGVLASGWGSNLEAMLRAETEWQDEGRVELVVSDRPEARALTVARDAGRAVAVLPDGGGEAAAEAREAQLEEVLEAHGIDLLVLAGFLRLVPEAVVRRLPGRIVNVHPALLPAFGGKGMYGRRVHEAVLEAGCVVTGATVHFVDEAYDSGKVLAQWPVPVWPTDTPEQLAVRVQGVEHALLPAAVLHLCRALNRGAAPMRFHPPGPLFVLGEDVRDYEIKGQMRRGFREL